MSKTKNYEEAIITNQLNPLLKSPIIPKKIPEIQPSPLILGSNKNLNREFMLKKINETNVNLIEEISFENLNNDTNFDKDEYYVIQDKIKPKGKKLCILEMLKKVSKKKNIYKLQ